MRYLVKARVKSGREPHLVRAIDDGTLGEGSIAGDEYLHHVEHARVSDQGVVTWVETCFCYPPLAEERPYWEEYFELLSVKDGTLGARAGTRTEQRRGPAATAIALRSSKGGFRRKGHRFRQNCVRATTD
jgi:hypothetical protein